jgi:hypothetical protein
LQAGTTQNFWRGSAKRYRKTKEFLDAICHGLDAKRFVKNERRADDVGEGRKGATRSGGRALHRATVTNAATSATLTFQERGPLQGIF